jgi:hypothetical protein
MYREKGNSIIILILLTALIVLGGGFLLNQKYQFIKIPSNETSKTSSNTVPYKSPKFKYQIEYSKIFSFSENSETGDVLLFPSDKPAVNGNEAILITVHHKSGDEETSKRPLAEYAKTAATEEIQNYNELNSIETITTKSGEIGYKTTWNRSGPFVNGVELNTKHEPSDPITYFGFPKEPYYTAQFYLQDKKYLSEYNQILNSFVTNK